MVDLRNVRVEYEQDSLREADCPADPMELFTAWYGLWQTIKPDYEGGNEMVVSSSLLDEPEARMVLLKEFSARGFVFFTNYDSQKGKTFAKNPKVSLLFFWSKLARQVRVSGLTTKISMQESSEYFDTRPMLSRIATVSSKQSSVISEQELQQAFATNLAAFKDKKIDYPENWGGYLVKPYKIEFFQGRPNRLHDRIVYEYKGSGWVRYRIAP